MSIVKTADNRSIALARQIGSGGEGAVYELRGNQDLVAKILRTTSPQKEKKLKALVSLSSPTLSRVSAIPQELIYDDRGRFTGFLMPRVQGGEPIHHFYSPSWRKTNYPNASWKTLLQVSRNVASAFHAIHSSSIVIGDVNPNSVFINRSGHATLIDADSYQVTYGSPPVTFTCDVGVANFTPPELQRERTFRGLIRHENHDLFGLSLLIFHLLFMGRHPFAGVVNSGAPRSLEENIANLSYAYSSLATSLQSPPLLSIKPESVCSRNLVQAFDTSFGADGLSERPTARKWIQLLDFQIDNLQACSRNSRHFFDRGIRDCPWCQVDSRGFSYFESSSGGNVQARASVFSIEQSRVVWQKIKELPELPDLDKILALNTSQVVAPSFSEEIRLAVSRRKTARFGALLFGLMSFVSLPAGPAAFALFIFLFIVCINYQPGLIQEEQKKIRGSIKSLEDELEALRLRLQPGGISSLRRDRHFRSEAQQAFSAISELPKMRDSKIAEISSKSVQLQKQRYLSAFLISDATISGIGPSRKSELQSHGIDSAADVERQRILRIQGFGPVLATSLVQWRNSLLTNFSVPAGVSAVSASDLAAIDQLISSSHDRWHKQLQASFAEMTELRAQQARYDFNSVVNKLRQGMTLKAQLQANLSALS